MVKKAGTTKAASKPPEQFLELSELLGYVGQVIGAGIPGSVWVRAEIASLTDRRHLYLDLVQAGDDGREAAKCRATLWARERFSLEGKFRRATGGSLSAGLQVLLRVTAEFHPQYGFSLHILDISPQFTLGDLALRLEESRRTLDAEGLLLKNRSLPLPTDYTRVAVIAPEGAAGLGDFRREADRIAGVVEFVYLSATFQGREAAGSLNAAVRAARELHEQQPLDALVVIRGGGAVSDLAWLNDLDFARALARFPVPVITGLGHARDDTLPDEVAALRTDTPSKAAAHILSTVVAGAAQAQADLRTVQRAAASALVEADAGARWAYERALRAARAQLRQAEDGSAALMRAVLGLTPQRTLERGYVLVQRAGRPVTRAAEVRPGDALTLTFSDGELDVRA